MCGSSRPSRAKEIGAACGLARAVAIVFLLVLTVAAGPVPAQAQLAPRPTPTPTPKPTDVNSDTSAGATAAHLGSSFLERLGDTMTGDLGAGPSNKPGSA